jgi:uncharacterized protein
MRDLKEYGDWALITGASMGLGRAFAHEIAAQGVNCVLVALEEELLEDVAQELREAYSVQCRCLALDLTQEGFLDSIEEVTHDIYIGLLINNAGYGCGGEFWTRDPVKAAGAVKLNCLAPVVLTRAFLPGMVERKRGGVVIVSSLMGLISAPYEAVYAPSKAFGLHFAEALWGELRGTGVDVLALCPAGMRTDFYAKDGISGKHLAFLTAVSDPPEKLARRALRKLGRKPTTAAGAAWLSGFLTRFVPRRVVVTVVRFAIRRLTNYK